MSHYPRRRAGRLRSPPRAGRCMMRCLVCGADMAGLSQVCGRCGADAAYDAGGFAGWVETRKFSTTRLRPGYDMEQVDAFLGAIRDTFLGIGGPSLTPDEIRAKRFST